MKMKQLMMAGGIAAALFLSLGIAAAQDNGPGGGFGGGPGGGGGGFGGGPGNFDPSQFQQRMLDNVREQLGFTNDTEWSAVEPLVQKAMTARREAQSGNMGRLFGRGGRGGGRAARAATAAVAVCSALQTPTRRLCKKPWMTMRRPAR